MYEHILFERKDRIATVTLNRPRVLNALSRALKAELSDALRRVRADETIRALVLTGAGDRAFSAGQDLNEAKDLDGPGAEEWVREYERLYDGRAYLSSAETEPVRATVRELARRTWVPRRPPIAPEPEPEQLALAV